MIKLLKGLLPKEEKDLNTLGSVLQKIYVFSLMWSIGAFLEISDRHKFEEYLRDNSDYYLDLPVIETPNTSIFDFHVNAEGKRSRMFKRRNGTDPLKITRRRQKIIR